MKQISHLITWILIVSLLSFNACSGDDGHSQTRKKVFKEAIHEYLRKNNMDMKVDKIEELTVKGNSATADASLMHAQEIVDVHVHWKFHFRKTKDTWRVTKHEET